MVVRMSDFFRVPEITCQLFVKETMEYLTSTKSQNWQRGLNVHPKDGTYADVSSCMLNTNERVDTWAEMRTKARQLRGECVYL